MIVFLTDCGDYTNIMKAAIRSLNDKSEFMDLANNIDPHNITEGAWMLFNNYFYFPKGSIFICVVDPGVGSERQGVIIQTKDYIFIGPDNGLMYSAAEDNRILRTFEIENDKMKTLAKAVFLKKYQTSKTFHGRDLFSVAAANLENNFNINFVGKTTKLKEKLDITPKINEGIVVTVDHFGNIITNIQNKKFSENIGYYEKTGKAKKCKVVVNPRKKSKKELSLNCYPFYGAAKKGELFLLDNSYGTVEIAIKESSANKRLKLKAGNEIRIS